VDRSRNPGALQDKIDAHARGLDPSQLEKKEGDEEKVILRTS
jgi:hypothetical protein